MRNWLQLSSIVGRRVADGDQQKRQQSSSSSSSRAPSLEPAPGVCCKPPAPRQVRHVTAMQVLARGPHVPFALFQPVLLASHAAQNKQLEEPHSSPILDTFQRPIPGCEASCSGSGSMWRTQLALCSAKLSCILPSCPLCFPPSCPVFCQAVKAAGRAGTASRRRRISRRTASQSRRPGSLRLPLPHLQQKPLPAAVPSSYSLSRRSRLR